MKPAPRSQKERLMATLSKRGMARLSELTEAGITAATVSRLERQGAVVRLGRGLYQLPNAPLDANHALAEASKRVPKGVICLVSAAAFHDLTDKIASEVWMAIGPKDWRPRVDTPRIHFVRFNAKTLTAGIEEHAIEGVSVRIYDPAKTVVDLFRYRRHIGLNVAIESLKEVLRQRKATPAKVGQYADRAGVWKTVRPYLEALTADG
jgi:predicted transcriptional regulator of viral defense system